MAHWLRHWIYNLRSILAISSDLFRIISLSADVDTWYTLFVYWSLEVLENASPCFRLPVLISMWTLWGATIFLWNQVSFFTLFGHNHLCYVCSLNINEKLIVISCVALLKIKSFYWTFIVFRYCRRPSQPPLTTIVSRVRSTDVCAKDSLRQTYLCGNCRIRL